MTSLALRLLLPAIALMALLTVLPAADQPPLTGPQTEQRFPPLKVPPGFEATLFACDPLVEYPSVIALGPRPGTLFVAADYMTGLGTEIVRRDEIRLIEDTDGDGYADRATVFAAGFNSIQGLAYHDGTVYVMHAPLLTALRDTRGTGKADERRDLLTGLGLPPEKNPPRLHCANGVVVGHDGWLYLALGDHGCDVPRPEGDRLVLEGGGILRCRPDGRDLHVFATGLRNIYDVALDEDSNVFVRDNENDGGTYMIRVCHSFFGTDHGYPYLYSERPDEALPPLADLGLGSSAGGVCYLERQFPPEYHGNLFFCEWGRSIVRYVPQRTGSSFAPLKEIEFAAGADNDPYGFKPTDVIVQRDGSLIVADWADGQRPRRGRGRVYRIAHVGQKAAKASPPKKGSGIAGLDSESYLERCQAQLALERQGREGRDVVRTALKQGRLGVRGRLHAVWLLASLGGPTLPDDLFDIARTDPEPRVQAQAIRALADSTDPVLTRHRLQAGTGDAALAARLAVLGEGRDPRVLLEVVLALGRLRWAEAPNWLRQHLRSPDAALAHATMQTLRQSANRSALLKLLDEPSREPFRAIVLRAVSGRFEPTLVDGLLDRLRTETDAARRREYADALTRVYRKPGPWVYWGYRPPPRPANTVAWERTTAIGEALGRTLADPDRTVRLDLLRRMQREKVPVHLATLSQWLREERQAERVATILESVGEQPAAEARSHLLAVVRESEHVAANRLRALALLVQGLDSAGEAQLLDLAGTLEDGPVLAEALRRLGQRPKLAAVPLLLRKTRSSSAEVRSGAIEALAELKSAAASVPVQELLGDPDARVRQTAADAAGKLLIRDAIEPLLKLARDPDLGVRGASLDALRRLREMRAVPFAVAALTDRATELPALDCLGDLGGPEQATVLLDLAKRSPSSEVLSRVVRLLTTWAGKEGIPVETRRNLDRALAEVQGAGSVILAWRILGPLPPQTTPSVSERFAGPGIPLTDDREGSPRWQARVTTATDLRLRLDPGKKADSGAAWLAVTELMVAEPTKAQFLAGCNGVLRIWLNGQLVHQRNETRPFQPDSERFNVTLARGVNRLLVQISGITAPEFQVRFRRQSSSAEHEKLTHAALTRPGDPARGRALFLNAEKSLCIKCHRIGDQGERIGPELTGVGSRFARIYLVESILEPSRTIAPSFETLAVSLKNGRLLTGVRVAETEQQLTIADNQGQKHVLAKGDIEERQVSPVSTMPEGLEKRLTPEEFVDLIAFLVSQKENRGR